MCVAKEHVGDDMRGIAIDDLVKEVRGVGQGIGAIPSTEDMANDPNTLSSVFGLLELFNHEREDPRVVWVRGIDEIEVI